jgi:hypothetical protein
MGCGKSAGCAYTRFSMPLRADHDRKPGDGWYLLRRPKRIWVCMMDADRWKAWEHDRWLTPTDKPGCLFMWGQSGDQRMQRLTPDEKAHTGYAHHICAEIEVEELVKGVMIRRWKTRRENNHWFDASYMSDVAANMKGINILAAKRKPADGGKPDQGGGWFARQKKR